MKTKITKVFLALVFLAFASCSEEVFNTPNTEPILSSHYIAGSIENWLGEKIEATITLDYSAYGYPIRITHTVNGEYFFDMSDGPFGVWVLLTCTPDHPWLKPQAKYFEYFGGPKICDFLYGP